MNRKLKIYEIFGLTFTIISGTLLHFVYEWSGNNKIIGLISPVNESTWEHLKLLFIPLFLYTILEYFMIGKKYPNFIISKAIGSFAGLFSIILLFYTYIGIIGDNFLWADIAVFITSVIISYFISYKIASIQKPLPKFLSTAGTIFMILIFIIFILFTLYPPHINLFLDPITKTYGII